MADKILFVDSVVQRIIGSERINLIIDPFN
jgi:hypothetical protein